MICIAADGGGKGGVSGGGGSNGQASQVATGSAARGYGFPVISLTSDAPATVTVQLTKDYDGAVPYSLTAASTASLVCKASLSSQSVELTHQGTCSTSGVVTFTFSSGALVGKAGLYYAEIRITGDPSAVFKAYVSIRKGFNDNTNTVAPVTAMAVRMALMDMSAEANQMLDDLEFSDVMILTAVERCIDEWNETPPELGRRFTAADFPYREHLIKGAIGYLMQMLAYRFTRNRMQYQASGFSLDKNDKGPQYANSAAESRNEWKIFIMSKKSELNMLECFGSVSLPYFD